MTSNAIQKSLLDNLLHFYDQSLFTDVDIRCANPMGHAKNRFKTVDSFQLMLSSVSPMLRKALEGAKGGEGDDGKACIIIADMDADRVESIHRRMMNTDAEGDEEDLDFLVEDCKLFGIDLHEYVAGRRDVKRDEADAKVERTVWKKPVYACIECDKEYTSEISYIKHRKMHLNKRKQQHQEQKVKRENKENEDEDENEDDEEEVEEPENERKTTSGRRVRQPKRFMDLILDTVGGGPIASDDEDVDYVLSSTVVDDDGEGALSSSTNVVVVRPSKRARKTKFVCGECKKNFSSKQALQNHVRLHKNDRKFRCGECGKGFVTAGCLATHNKAHDGSAKTFPCSHCDKLFNNTSNLLRHHRALHFEYSDKRRFACKICYKEFKDPSALSAHARTHEGNREFVCEFCQKSFLTAPHLRVHLRIHTGERPFECSRCQRRFVTNGQLKSHVRHKHEGIKIERTHLCTHCGVSFVKAYDLKVHAMKHTGELPHKCDVCSKGFRSARHLSDHSRTHTGEKPYCCETCHVSFRAPGGLRQHFKSHDACYQSATEGAYSTKKDKRRFAPAQPLHKETIEYPAGSTEEALNEQEEEVEVEEKDGERRGELTHTTAVILVEGGEGGEATAFQLPDVGGGQSLADGGSLTLVEVSQEDVPQFGVMDDSGNITILRSEAELLRHQQHHQAAAAAEEETETIMTEETTLVVES